MEYFSLSIKFFKISLTNTGKTGDVERRSCSTPMLDPEEGIVTSVRRIFPPQRLTFFPWFEWDQRRINKCVVGSKRERILYFNSILKAWVGKLSTGSAAPPNFTGLRPCSRLLSAHLKTACQAELFDWDYSFETRNLLKSLFTDKSWKFECYNYTKPKLVPPEGFLFPANPGSKNQIKQFGIHGDPANCDLVPKKWAK